MREISTAVKALICALLFAAFLAGCSLVSGGLNTGKPAERYNYTGYQDYTEDGLGVTLKLPGKYLDDETIVPGRYEVMFGDLSKLDVPKAETDPDIHLDLFFMPRKGEYCLFKVLAYPAKKWDGWLSSGKKAADITQCAVTDEICRKDGVVYIYGQPATDTSGFDTALKASYDEVMSMLPAIKASIRPTTNTAGNIVPFTTKDIYDKPVDISVFAGHQLTMINIWATFCNPCIKELPDLQKMSEEMPDGAQLISIVGDVQDKETLKLAQQIAQNSGVSFPCIVPDGALKRYMDKNIVAYPTTLFVDSTGKVIGDPIVGERSISVYKEVLAERLAKAGS